MKRFVIGLISGAIVATLGIFVYQYFFSTFTAYERMIRNNNIWYIKDIMNDTYHITFKSPYYFDESPQEDGFKIKAILLSSDGSRYYLLSNSIFVNANGEYANLRQIGIKPTE